MEKKRSPAQRGRKRKVFQQKTFWERGYRSWGFWMGNTKLGVVELGPYGKWDGKYRWQAASLAGEADTLAAAKRAVEEFAAYDKLQLSLRLEP